MRHFVFGGRFGDVCHAIPAAYEHFKRTGERVRFTSSQEFASILEGCSYIEAHAAPVAWQKINDIVAYAKAKHGADDFSVCACYGHDYSPGYQCFSFLRDSWRLSRCPAPPETVPLIFDRRSPEREQRLLEKHVKSSKPFILVSTFGKSSPFNYAHNVHEDIRNARPDCEIVDMNYVKAERVYDLLGLFEKAVALVTIDTLHLHLSAAVPGLPVFALVCDGHTRWNRTDWRPQQVWRSTYALYPNRREQFKKALVSMKATPTIRHIFSYVEQCSEDTKRRMKVAQDSWQAEAQWAGNWKIQPVKNSDLGRVMTEDGDLPFVKDLIAFAVPPDALDTDIISFSNADVGCVHGITSQVLDSLAECGAAFTHRFDVVGRPIQKPILLESEVVNSCKWYPGSDWFFFTVGFWRRHHEEFPDMVIGREFWDCVMRQLIKKHGGREIGTAVWHEKHASKWDSPGNRENLAGNKHNRRLGTKFFAENGSNDQDPFRNTWNVRPGTTVTADPLAMRNLQASGVRKHRPNLVFPRRIGYTGTAQTAIKFKKLFK